MPGMTPERRDVIRREARTMLQLPGSSVWPARAIELLDEVDQLRESMSWIEARGVVFALERDEARSAGERVKALHSPKPGTRIVPCSLHAPHEAWPPGRCPDCTSEPTDVCSHCVGQASPCPTLRALDGGETP